MNTNYLLYMKSLSIPVAKKQNLFQKTLKYDFQRLANKKSTKVYSSLALFSFAYYNLIQYARRSENDILKVGAAGSLTFLISESAFYNVDAINAKSKMLDVNVSFREMVSRIYKTEGLKGFYQGYSTVYYSQAVSGFIYFTVYKSIKKLMKDNTQSKSASVSALIYAAASTLAEIVTLAFYYPYELVKIRLLT